MDWKESSFRRAFRDTIAAQKTALFMWVGQSMLAVAGVTWLTATALTNASILEQVLRAVAGGLIGLIVASLTTLIFNFIRAPYRQRNELRASIRAIPGQPSVPILAESQLFFSNLDCGDFGHGGEGNFGGLDPSKFYAYVSYIANAQGEMPITRIALMIDGQEYPAVRWHTHEVGGGGNYISSFPIEITKIVGIGRHEAKIVAFANSKSWQSQEFYMDVPTH